MIHFGPSGNSEIFYEQGYKHTYQAMEWLKNMGLNAFEYSFGRGIRIKEETAAKIGDEAKANGINVSVHAPYFINLAADDERFEKNIAYFTESARAAVWLGAERVVFHPGAPGKLAREEAFEIVKKNFKTILGILDEEGFNNITFCPETMGKINQIGDLKEIIALSNIDERVIPTIDFGHLHARGIGAINKKEDFAAILDALEDGIGYERTKRLHVHFSKIEYTKMGEKRHRIFAEEEFGPDFANLAPLLVERNLEPTIICESKGTMAEDALAMKRMYQAEMNKREA